MEDGSRLEELRRRVANEPGSRAFVLLAEEYRQLGRLDEAQAALRDGLAQQPGYLAARVALGRCELEAGKPEDSVRTLETVVEADPTQMVAYKLLITAHLRSGNPSKSRSAFESYRLLNPQDPELGELESSMEGNEGDPETETPQLRPYPRPPGTGRVLAPARKAPAAASLSRLVPRTLSRPRPAERSPSRSGPAATLTLGELYLQQGHVNEAESVFRRVAEGDSGSSAALDALARIEELRAASHEDAKVIPLQVERVAEDLEPAAKRPGPDPTLTARIALLRSWAHRLESVRERRDAPA